MKFKDRGPAPPLTTSTTFVLHLGLCTFGLHCQNQVGGKSESKVPFFYVNGGKWRQKHRGVFGHQSSIFAHSFQTCSGACHNVRWDFPSPGGTRWRPVPEAISGPRPHPPYSPDSAPLDFYTFITLKKKTFGRRRFTSDDTVRAEVQKPFLFEIFFCSLPNTWTSKGAKSGRYGGWGGVQKWLRMQDVTYRQGLEDLIVRCTCLNKLETIWKNRGLVPKISVCFSCLHLRPFT
jgi:hypothetical protein